MKPTDRAASAAEFLKIVKVAPPAPQPEPRESNLVERLAKRLRELGLRVTKIHGSAFQEAGLPDLLVRRDMRCLWIETKSSTRKLTPKQRRFRELEHAAGVPVLIVRPADIRLGDPVVDHGICSGERKTARDPAQAAWQLIVWTHAPEKAVEIAEREWS